MKTCPKCRKSFDDIFDECPDCAAMEYEPVGEEIASGVRGARSSEAVPSRSRSRPTGETVLLAGGTILALGLVTTFATDLYSSIFFVGLGLANLGVIGLIIGYVVYAISFLPGKSD